MDYRKAWPMLLLALLLTACAAAPPVKPPPCPQPDPPPADKLVRAPAPGYFLAHQAELLKRAGFPSTPAPDSAPTPNSATPSH